MSNTVTGILFNGMTYGIYERVKNNMYFTELLENINIKMRQHSEMVDMLIYKKKKTLNTAAPPYLPEAERDITQKPGKLDQTLNEEKQIIKEKKTCIKLRTST